MEREYVTAELADGTILGPVRVTWSARSQAEKTAKAHGWHAAPETALRFTALIAFHALRDAGLGTWPTLAAFDADLVDLEHTKDEEATAADPTNPAPLTDSSEPLPSNPESTPQPF